MTISAKKYWDDRYLSGGTSGLGSYGLIAEHKAKVINEYIDKYHIETISDYGCGDGNQLLLLRNFLKYDGFDISKSIVSKCMKLNTIRNTSFHSDIDEMPIAELTLSLDVIYHILDESDFNEHLQQLFSKSTKLVIIFSTDYILDTKCVEHIRHRKFTDIVAKKYHDFKLIDIIDNEFDTAAKFYIYEKII